jgi:hypothetical protein
MSESQSRTASPLKERCPRSPVVFEPILGKPPAHAAAHTVGHGGRLPKCSYEWKEIRTLCPKQLPTY